MMRCLMGKLEAIEDEVGYHEVPHEQHRGELGFVFIRVSRTQFMRSMYAMRGLKYTRKDLHEKQTRKDDGGSPCSRIIRLE